jgi:hypothetical protein
LIRLVFSAAVSAFVVLLTYTFVYKYDASDQFADAERCMGLLNERSSQTAFEWTGLIGQRFLKKKTLVLIGKDTSLDNTVRSIVCYVTDGGVSISDPTEGEVKSG